MKQEPLNKAQLLLYSAIREQESRRPAHTNPWMEKHLSSRAVYKNEMTRYSQRAYWYQILACLVNKIQPKISVEMGGEHGISAAFIASEMPKDGIIYSVDVVDGWKDFPPKEERLIKLIGNDSDPDTYPKDFPWKDIDLWLIDSEHYVGHIFNQFKLIEPHLTKGAIIIIDDIWHDHDYVWRLLLTKPWESCHDNRLIKPSGFSISVVT